MAPNPPLFGRDTRTRNTTLHSSAEHVGDVVTQIIGFKSGHKKTWHGVKTSTIEQSEFTRFDLVDGRRVYVRTDLVEWFEVIKEV